jgi:hypothetical protein
MKVAARRGQPRRPRLLDRGRTVAWRGEAADPGVYATTGGQPVPNADNIRYDMIAPGCGYPRTYAFTEIGDFEGALPEIMGKPGPVFVA